MPTDHTVSVESVHYWNPQGAYVPVILSITKPKFPSSFRLGWNSHLLLLIAPLQSSFQATLILSTLDPSNQPHQHLDYAQEVLGHAAFPILYVSPLRACAPEGLPKSRLPPNQLPCINYLVPVAALRRLAAIVGPPEGRGHWWASRLSPGNTLKCQTHTSRFGAQFWIACH